MKIKCFTIVALVCAAVAARAGVISDTLYMEARGEGERGLRAVATVIYNRAKGSAAQMEKVCLKPYQFSCWNGKAPKSVRIAPKSAFDRRAYALCLSIEKELLSGNFSPLGEWTHYYNPRLCSPTWAQGVPCVKIGNHNFLKAK